MLDKYLYVICNHLKMKILLQAAHAFRSTSIPLLHN